MRELVQKGFDNKYVMSLPDPAPPIQCDRPILPHPIGAHRGNFIRQVGRTGHGIMIELAPGQGLRS